jgi:predicted DNA-binding transcriptional regulator AlpA
MIEMENINLIKQIALDLELIKKALCDQTEKRWLNVKELAHYLGYSKDRIYKIKDEYFEEGEHFHNKTGKLLFDRVAIDSWVVGRTTNETNKSKRQVVDHILSSVK